MMTRSNRPCAALWAALLVALSIVAAGAPAVANNNLTSGDIAQYYGSCPAPDSAAHLTYGYQPDPSEVYSIAGTSAPAATVFINLDSAGNVVDASVWRSSGNAAFDTEAVRAVRLSRFAPEMHNCVGYAGSYLVDVYDSRSHLAYGGIGSPPLYTFQPIIIRANCPYQDSPAQVTVAYQPEWPPVALEQGVGPATATVQVTLDANGNVVDEQIWRSTGNDQLDNEALKAVRLSSYSPEMRGCVRYAGSYLMDIAFE